ncbi:MAG TPA: tetratricopeptide repeat protein [Azospirillum sp.]|nr:tetratricopeptide repeat protein [Azospirillum sp.]
MTDQEQSPQASPPTASAWKAQGLVAMGRAYYEQGLIDQACKALIEALSHDADNVDALFLTGVIAHQAGLHDVAIRNLGRAVDLRPELVLGHTLLALEFLSLGRYADALASFGAAARLEPESPDNHSNLGNLYKQLGKADLAQACFRRAVALRPDFALAYYNLACTLQDMGDLRGCEPHLRRALSLAPDHLSSRYNLAISRQKSGALAEAATLYRQVLERNPEHREAANNLAMVLHGMGHSEEASAIFERGLAGSLPPAVFNKALLDLSLGRLSEGWKGYEARFDQAIPDNTNHERAFVQPRWNGDAGIAGKRLLIWREQGIGDEILFASCLPDLEATGARVTFECSPKLHPLFQRSFPFADVVCEDRSQDPSRRDLDVHLPVGSLPRYLRRTPADFPAEGGFLRPDAGRVVHWRRRLEALGPAPYVGLCWRGKGLQLQQRQDQFTRIEDWAPVLQVPGVTFVNMQYDDAEAETAQAEAAFGTAIHTLSDIDMWNDLDDVAALLKAMDLLLTVGTSVMSLAGGVGLPTHLLGRISLESWPLLNTGRLPWYPSVRPHLCRAGEPWERVIRPIAAELEDRAGRTARG